MKSVIILSLFALSCAVVVKHPLIRVRSVRERKMAEGTWVEHMRQKRQFEEDQSSSGTETDPIYDYDEVNMVGEISVGTPSRKFLVLLHTATADLWITNKICNYCPINCFGYRDYNYCLTQKGCNNACCAYIGHEPNGTCDGKTSYDSSKSTSYTHDGWQFLWNTCEGFYGRDRVCLPSSDDLCVYHQRFGQITKLGNFFKDLPYDGVFGLAIYNFDRPTPPVVQMKPKLDSGLFTIYLTNEHRDGAVTGQITYGAIDKEYCSSSISYTPLLDRSFWYFALESIGVGDAKSGGKHWWAMSDTSTPLLRGPADAVDLIAKQLGGKYNSTTRTYFIDCDAKPDPITLKTGGQNGQEYNITYKSYILPSVHHAEKCILALGRYQNSMYRVNWYIGTAFVKEYCHIYDFDNARLGFAKSLE